MRLIETTTLELVEFFEPNVPPYAILTHTWDEDEITFQEMTRPTFNTRLKAGYLKISRFAALAKEKGFVYIWIDTCTIDKSSSAELSEAINSMFRWYQNSSICFAYLSDAETINARDLQTCRWFTRGWTLQELIAPKQIMFYASNMSYIGDKQCLLEQLSSISGISHTILTSCDPTSASIAQRMSWSSKRRTTRPEDIAYSLLGIFDINIPLLYGEGGEKAFIRLQEEIMKSSDDHSLFVWKSRQDEDYMDIGAPFKPNFSLRGLLARSPEEFLPDISTSCAIEDAVYNDIPYSVTNKGICVTLPLISSKLIPREPENYYLYMDFVGGWCMPKRIPNLNCLEEEGSVFAVLNCVWSLGGYIIGVLLVKVGEPDQYARTNSDVLVLRRIPEHFEHKTIYVRQNIKISKHFMGPAISRIHILLKLPQFPSPLGVALSTMDHQLSVTTENPQITLNLHTLKGWHDGYKSLILRIKPCQPDSSSISSFEGFWPEIDSDWLVKPDKEDSKLKRESQFAENISVMTAVLLWNVHTGKYGCVTGCVSQSTSDLEIMEILDLDRISVNNYTAISKTDENKIEKRYFTQVRMLTKLINDQAAIDVDVETAFF